MAGDHKCPVCQATFTRPQHVARHMRSHTGDRPYKCQHCGDQFARSDLLSRHVNKCHAGDKPPTTTAPNRRKGQQSSTRATTSKQACDQCVMATLPCDGANPCSKCIQRKSVCTYVKFQRQTAPVGPGHRHSHSMDSTSSTSSNISFPRPDELFLGPPPMTVPSMGPTNDMYYPVSHPQFAFNPPGGAASWENSPSNAPSLTLSSSAADSGHDSSSSDIASRYRDVDMLRSSILPLPSGYSANPAIIPNYYGNQPASGPGDQWTLPADYPSRRDKNMQEGFAQYLPPASSSQLTGPASLLHPSNFEFQGGGLYNLHTRRGSVDGYSDGGSAASGPNSATSSSAHLPLDLPQGEQQQQQSNQQQLDFSAYNQFGDGQRPPPSRDGRFASSFGLMSLADGDGNYPGNFNSPDGSAPFFSQTALKLPPQDSTPRPFRTDEEMGQLVQATGSARDREVEMRELRDFWKQYLRTPLSGPSLGQTPKAELINNQLGNFGDSRPTPKRGLSRVASLPSVRTPPDEKSSAMSITRLSQSHVLPTPGNGARSGHTTDDLKSYEQAILARTTPLNLNLAPKKGRMSNASSVSPSGSPAMSQQSIQNGQPRQPGTFVEPGPNNIPSARAGGLSSLNASDHHAQPADVRPSFKRLPSQTLENTVQKRALFSWGGNENDDVIDDSESDADGPSSKTLNRQFSSVRESSSSDRFRRLSAPTTTLRPGSSELSPSGEHDRFTSYASKMNAHHANGGGPLGLSGPGPGAQIDPMVRS